MWRGRWALEDSVVLLGLNVSIRIQWFSWGCFSKNTIICHEDIIQLQNAEGLEQLVMNTMQHHSHHLHFNIMVCWVLWAMQMGCLHYHRSCCRTLSCSALYFMLAVFCVAQYRGWSSIPRCRICCLQTPKRPTRHCISFFMVELQDAIVCLSF